MKYSALFIGLLPYLAAAIPLDTDQKNVDADASPVNYGVYGAYGSYGSYPDVISAPAPAPAPAAVPPVLPASNPGNFVAISSRSGDVNLHLRPISASNLKFYVGKPTSTYCPLADCSGYVNFTVFSARPNEAASVISLLTAVPGGQQVYVAPDGQLGYTQAHSGSMPPGSVTTPFQYIPESEPNRVGSLTFNGGFWVACQAPEGNGVYQIYAQAASSFSRTDCTSISFSTSSYQGNSAWQYN